MNWKVATASLGVSTLGLGAILTYTLYLLGGYVMNNADLKVKNERLETAIEVASYYQNQEEN